MWLVALETVTALPLARRPRGGVGRRSWRARVATCGREFNSDLATGEWA
jgi:hypothetical protein